MTVQQVYMFNIGNERIRSALATDGTKVQYMTPDAGPDDEDNRLRAAHDERMLKIAKPGTNPIILLAGNVMAMVTDPVEFPDFNAAAQAAEELFRRGAVADEFVV